MNQFFYEAVDATGKTIVGKIEGQDVTDVQRQLVQSGYRPQSIVQNGGAASATVPALTNLSTVNSASLSMPALSSQAGAMQNVSPSGSVARTGGIVLAGNAAKVQSRQKKTVSIAPQVVGGASSVTNVSKLGGVNDRDRLLFFQQLASLVRSGMSIYMALDNLASRTANQSMAQTAREMAEAARTGNKISDVMERYPRIYAPHLVGTVRAGEMGGFLEIALAEIALEQEQRISLYKGAWIPKAMAVQALWMLPFAIPLFTSLFHSFDLRENLLLYIRQVTLIYVPLTAAIHGGILLASRRLQLPQYRRRRDELALKMPPFGDLQRQVALANFVRMLRRLYQAGLQPIQAWEGAMNTASNVVIREKLASSYGMMQQGASLPEAFEATGLFHNSVEQLLLTGQHSGQMPEMLDQAAEYYQELAEQSAKKARFMMLRIGVLAMLILGGGTLLWLAKTYFGGMFDFVSRMFPEADGV